MTVGEDDRWYGGSARTDLGDFGPLRGDASEIPPIWRRGVLYDVLPLAIRGATGSMIDPVAVV